MVCVVEPADTAGTIQAGQIDVALVNNMPDAALHQTEAQFSRLLDAGSDGTGIRLHRYTLPTIRRREQAADHIAAHYFPLAQLWDSEPAAVIITGCEPLSANLTREPFWPDLIRLLEWSRERATSTIASCLAAHAALLAFDGVHRQRLSEKCSGVFPQDVSVDALTSGLPRTLAMPHSRLNDVPTGAIRDAGYRPVIASEDVGWTVGVKDDGRHLLVLMQGHPEYDAETLLLEFRRDLRRFLSGERPDFPAPPTGYFTPTGDAIVAELRTEATTRHDPRLIAHFPMAQLLAQIDPSWQQPANRLYTNWLTQVRARSADRVGV
jgi:homoserine O-succinyltransferase/O-acetyltransferase